MAEAVVYRVEGLDRLTVTLNALPADLAAIAPPGAAELIGTEAKKRAPKRTGRLIRSWGTAVVEGKLTFGFDAPHAAPINFGVGPRRGKRGPHNIKATEFFTGAVADKRAQWIDEYIPPIEEALDKIQGA